MSLIKNSVVVGGSNLQTYLKDGNNIHTDFVEEWIFVEDSNLAASVPVLWRLSDRDSTIRLISLWATTTGNITINIQHRGTIVFPIVITNTQAANGYNFPACIVPAKYDLAIVPAATVTRLFLTAKEVSICENFAFSRT